jgi:hypothetical protein
MQNVWPDFHLSVLLEGREDKRSGEPKVHTPLPLHTQSLQLHKLYYFVVNTAILFRIAAVQLANSGERSSPNDTANQHLWGKYFTSTAIMHDLSKGKRIARTRVSVSAATRFSLRKWG